MDPVRTVALCDTDDGRRCVAVSGDAELAAHSIAHELIGTRVIVGQGTFSPV
jgi:hypothetical protein